MGSEDPPKPKVVLFEHTASAIEVLDMREQLEELGCEVHQTYPESATPHPPHDFIVLMGLGQPAEVGFSIIRALRQAANTPTIVITADDTPQAAARALELSVVLLNKPVHTETLASAVREALKRNE